MKWLIWCCLLTILSFNANHLFACDCDNPTRIGFARADFVFSGKVVKFTPINDTAIVSKIEVSPGTQWVYKATIEIKQIFKGQLPAKIIEVYTHSESMADCGFPFEENYSYKIFATKKNGLAYTDLCTENIFLDK